MTQNNLLGKSIMGYTATEVLGSGTYGTVYKVVKTNAAGSYTRALKHIAFPPESQYYSVLNSMGGNAAEADQYFSGQFQSIVSEIQILSRLSEEDDRHIVRYYENDIVKQQDPVRYDIFILMEYLTPLNSYLHSHSFTVGDVVQLGLDVLAGIKLCHENGVIHRDIKTENIFAAENGQFKIGDFGVSTVLDNSTRAATMVCTPSYSAPEIFREKGGYGKSVDLYSLGIVLYRLLNHERNPFLPPFPMQYSVQDESLAYERRMRGEIPELPDLGGESLGRTILKAIAEENVRYQTADEFIDALERALASTSRKILDESIHARRGQMEEPDATYRVRKPIAGSRAANNNAESFGTVKQNQPSAPMGRENKRHSDRPLSDDQPYQQPEIKNSQFHAGFFCNYKKNILFTVCIIAAGLACCFLLLPWIFGEFVSLKDWLFGKPESVLEIIKTSEEAGMITPDLTGIWVIRILFYYWILDIAAAVSLTVYSLLHRS